MLATSCYCISSSSRWVDFKPLCPPPPLLCCLERKMRRLDWKLHRRVEARKIINKKYMVNELVADLQSNFPEYRRLKNFSKRVQQTLESLENPPLQKKRKKVDDDDKEEQILLHCRTTSTSSFSTISEDEDAITQEPGFDVTKSLLRSSYSCCSKENVSAKSVQEEKSLEMEVDSKANNKILDFMEVGDTHRSHKRKMENADNKEDYARQEELVKRKDNGPRFKDLGGIEKVLDQLMMEVIMPFYHPQLPHWLGVKPVSGILFHGPPGCGKTVLARAIANEIGVPFYQISATEVVSGVSGASEENIRDLFSKAHRTAPSIVFIDEIDAIASKRESLQREMERRIVTQLMTCMDESHQHIAPADADPDPDSGTSGRKPGYVLVIGATNRPGALDPALRRPGRFDREILLGVPDEKARAQILSVVTSHSRLEGAFDIDKLARSTPGFVGADLASLANTAGNLAIRRAADRRKSALSEEAKVEGNKEEWWRRPWTPEELESLNITMADYEEAIKMVQPSSRREGFSTIPNVKWEDVGGLDLSRKEFDRYIVNHIKHREDYAEFGVDLEMGILLYGPPGCGKTLIAKAVANEAGANFIYIKGPEVLDQYVGQSEMNVRTIFTRARACAPCILFFDEVDALTTKRGKEGVVERVLNQLLIELDGAGQRQGVYVIGATNRPEVMDPAVLRPGRFGKLLYVPLPGPNERCLILKALAQKKPIDEDVDLTDIGRREACENLSGSDLAKLMNEAALAAMEEKQLLDPGSHDMRRWTIKERHFDQALKKAEPSVTAKQRNYYENLSRSFGEA